MAQVNADTLGLQLEKVRKTVPLLYERDEIFITMLDRKADVERVSSRSARVPLEIRPGGKAKQATMDGDDLGRGSGTKYEVALISAIPFVFAVEITKLVEYSTNTAEKAVQNAAQKAVKNGMAQFRAYLDKLVQTAGNGVLGNITNVAANVFTLGTPEFTQLVYFNQTIQVYDATLTTNRGTANITAIDPDAKKITVDAAPGGTVATDLIVTDGVAGASPTSLFGIKYHQSNAATGTWMNLNRATYPEIRTPRVNAANSALVTSQIRLALNKIRKALGTKTMAKVIAYCNLDQEHAYEELGIAISEIMKSPGTQGLELLFQGNKTMGGAPIVSSINADPTRIDFIDLSQWFRVVMKEIDYYEVGGQTVFPIYGASGGLASSYIFYFDTSFQVGTGNPRRGSYIDALLQPAGY